VRLLALLQALALARQGCVLVLPVRWWQVPR
jgi:hypothetical protein